MLPMLSPLREKPGWNCDVFHKLRLCCKTSKYPAVFSGGNLQASNLLQSLSRAGDGSLNHLGYPKIPRFNQTFLKGRLKEEASKEVAADEACSSWKSTTAKISSIVV